MVVDFQLVDITKKEVNICWLAMKRLNYKNDIALSNYNLKVLEHFKEYNIFNKLNKIETLYNTLDPDLKIVKIDILDKQVSDLSLITDKYDRKFQTKEISFSPEVSRIAKMWYLLRTTLK